MRAVLQRVTRAAVSVDEQVCGAIDSGLLILLGIGRADDGPAAAALARRCCRLRIFEDDAGRMNRSLLDTGGAALVVSQFTLLADTGRGLRPSFEAAARPEQARPLYEEFVAELRRLGVRTGTGIFGARMNVCLTNDGPVTIVLDSRPSI
jgi:D-tyrosyl-tRNA(Tyr) deacylase